MRSASAGDEAGDSPEWVATDVWRRTPHATSDGARRRMQATRSAGTRPERALRSALHRLGLRYRVNRLLLPDLRRRADVVFGRHKVAVYVDGCFWHGCEKHVAWPKSNAAWWREKITSTQRRDRDTDARLAAAGWTVVRVWEHEDPLDAAHRIERLLRDVQRGSS